MIIIAIIIIIIILFGSSYFTCIGMHVKYWIDAAFPIRDKGLILRTVFVSFFNPFRQQNSFSYSLSTKTWRSYWCIIDYYPFFQSFYPMPTVCRLGERQGNVLNHFTPDGFSCFRFEWEEQRHDNHAIFCLFAVRKLVLPFFLHFWFERLSIELSEVDPDIGQLSNKDLCA